MERTQQNLRHLHWSRNRNVDIVATPEATTMWLGTTRGNEQSPLFLLNGHEGSLIRHILSYTESAIFPCDCCFRTRPLVYCCKRRRRYIKDRTRPPRDEDECEPEAQGEVPERLFCEDKVLLWSEGVHVWSYSGSTSYSLDDGSPMAGMSCACQLSISPSYVACTVTGFFSPFLTFRWDDFARIGNYSAIRFYHDDGTTICFEQSSCRVDEDAKTNLNSGLCFDIKKRAQASSMLTIIRNQIREAYLKKRNAEERGKKETLVSKREGERAC